MLRVFLAASYGFAVVLGARDYEADDAEEAYELFRTAHGRPAGADDPEAYAVRLALFRKRQAEVEALNARPGSLWKAGLSRFADYSDSEFRSLLGFRRVGRRGDAAAPSSFLEVRPHQVTLAESKDWRQELNTSATFQRDQGQCGSCWAVAAVGALEMHAELRGGHSHELSFEQLVDCVPNPDHCGGAGGCQGATAELAFEYVAASGLVEANKYKGYGSGGDGKCRPPPAGSTRAEGFVRLPENRYQPLLEMVALKGPVVVSVDASDWGLYQSGIFDHCQRDATVNHAVLMIGYGTDRALGKDYWLIRNSWASGWGERGLIRVLRHAADEGEAGYCGTDRKPKDGVGCDGGPQEIPVCGMCGILSDSSYPTGVALGRI